jgi:hypothetical protein
VIRGRENRGVTLERIKDTVVIVFVGGKIVFVLVTVFVGDRGVGE